MTYKTKSKEFQRPPTAWEIVEKTKKLKTGDWVNDKTRDLAERYQKRREEVLQCTGEGTSTQESLASINENEIYLGVVGENNKGHVYGLGTLSKKFSRSTHAQSTLSQPPMVEAIEEMRQTIDKLNAELLAKEDKERMLEQKMEQLMKNHELQNEHMRQQSERMHQQDQQMQLILRHFQINSLMPGPSLPTTTMDDPRHHVEDEQHDHVDDTPKDC
ncbi:uncharacterized protein LOC109794080 [Cajanus cajan]|uniref:uncharacterized protein LOC109794080 n=1 Tax=Cajanus cajan TaxID=3821 RepID=UPI0010FADCFF|nr:uncharacterized protein LOC109794080 [Cajanus cajan]